MTREAGILSARKSKKLRKKTVKLQVLKKSGGF